MPINEEDVATRRVLAEKVRTKFKVLVFGYTDEEILDEFETELIDLSTDCNYLTCKWHGELHIVWANHHTNPAIRGEISSVDKLFFFYDD